MSRLWLCCSKRRVVTVRIDAPASLDDTRASRHVWQTSTWRCLQTHSDSTSARSTEGCWQSHIWRCGLTDGLRCSVCLCASWISYNYQRRTTGLQSASVSRTHTCENQSVNAPCCINSLKIQAGNYLLCFHPKNLKGNCNSKTITTVQCINNSLAEPLRHMYKPFAETVWTNFSLKFNGRSFCQDGDPKHCSCALSTLTPRGEQRVLTFYTLFLFLRSDLNSRNLK